MRIRLWLGAVLPLVGSAQPGLSLRAAVDRALATHPALAVFEHRVAASEGARVQAGLAPSPKLVLQSENTRPYGDRTGFVFWRDTDDFAYLQNTFETAGKRQRRVDLASTGVRRAELERELTQRQVAFRVAQAYWTAAGAQRSHELLVESSRTMASVVEYHETRVKEGAMAEADLIRVRLEARRLAIAGNRALLDAQRARIHLFREMGQTQFLETRMTDPLEAAAPDVNGDEARALERRTEMKLARLGIEHARAMLRLQEANAKPNLDVLFGYKRTAGLDTMLGGVQMDLPFRNRNQGSVTQASVEIRVAESNLAATEAMVRAEVQAARADYELRRKQTGELLEPLLQQAAETYRIAEAAYREGGTDLLRLLDAQRVRIEAQVAHVRALEELQQSRVALQSAVGELP